MKTFNLSKTILDTFVFPAGYCATYNVDRAKLHVSRGQYSAWLTLYFGQDIDVEKVVNDLVASVDSQYKTAKDVYQKVGQDLLSYELAEVEVKAEV